MLRKTCSEGVCRVHGLDGPLIPFASTTPLPYFLSVLHPYNVAVTRLRLILKWGLLKTPVLRRCWFPRHLSAPNLSAHTVTESKHFNSGLNSSSSSQNLPRTQQLLFASPPFSRSQRLQAEGAFCLFLLSPCAGSSGTLILPESCCPHPY